MRGCKRRKQVTGQRLEVARGDSDEGKAPGAARLEVSEPRCKIHGAIEGSCPCMEGESVRLACGT